MSHWVYLEDRTRIVEEYGDGSVSYATVDVPVHVEGGTYRVGGTTTADLNVTYNYARQFTEAGLADGLDTLHDMTARDAIPLLARAVMQLGTERDPDYWQATAGNAGYALSILLSWARRHPDAVFRVS